MQFQPLNKQMLKMFFLMVCRLFSKMKSCSELKNKLVYTGQRSACFSVTQIIAET